MSVEDRLRRGLADNAAHIEPQVERQLTTVLAHARRGERARRAGVVAVAAVALGVIALVIPDSAPPRQDERLVAPAGPAPAALTGTLVTTVPADLDSGAPGELAGRWTVRLDAGGTMLVQPPPSYQGVVSGALHQSRSGTFRTSLFAQDLCSGLGVGAYSWTRSGSTVAFEVVDDTCEGRVLVLTSAPWLSAP